uniref:Uncharacterized protein n=1 Tax=Takifugu rubripes TaxID=31033 RepID=A0A674P4N8_TAKRU
GGCVTDLPEASPVCLIVLGMAGSGKTTLFRCVFQPETDGSPSLCQSPPYVINLDPAVHEVPFPANIGERPTFWTRLLF